MLKLECTVEQLNELKRHSRTHPVAHLREKAGGLLKISQGHSAAWVARYGLLTQRRPNTVRRWVHTFNAHGFEALQVGTGRGRKPAFFP